MAANASSIVIMQLLVHFKTILAKLSAFILYLILVVKYSVFVGKQTTINMILLKYL